MKIQIGEATMCHGEALKTLMVMEPESVDAVLTGPPYSMGGIYAAQRQRSPSEKYQDHDVKTKRRSFTGDNRDQRSFITWATP